MTGHPRPVRPVGAEYTFCGFPGVAPRAITANAVGVEDGISPKHSVRRIEWSIFPEGGGILLGMRPCNDVPAGRRCSG